MVKPFTIIAIAGLMLYVMGSILYHAVSAWLGVEEPGFFLIAVVAAPIVTAFGLIGSVVAIVAERWDGWRAPQ